MITNQQVTDAIEAVVAEAGEDFVYASIGSECVYVHEGKPSCIVGRVLSRLGVPLERLIKADTENMGMSISAISLINNMLEKGEIDLEDPGKVGWVLRLIQNEQDQGEPWGGILNSYRMRMQ